MLHKCPSLGRLGGYFRSGSPAVGLPLEGACVHGRRGVRPVGGGDGGLVLLGARLVKDGQELVGLVGLGLPQNGSVFQFGGHFWIVK